MLYPELFKQLEAVRWSMDTDIPWSQYDASRLSEEQAQTIKMNAITEWAALPATEMFLRDIDSLDSHTAFLFDKINFLMDATVGFININQNKIIKIFSVASVALLPPTLIASIYGMNFKNMPELESSWGYPFALVLMLLSVAAPFIYFRRKGWLK